MLKSPQTIADFVPLEYLGHLQRGEANPPVDRVPQDNANALRWQVWSALMLCLFANLLSWDTRKRREALFQLVIDLAALAALMTWRSVQLF